jgi:hypothetical protein
MSGYADNPQQLPDEASPKIHRLQKPFTLEALAATVRRVLE